MSPAETAALAFFQTAAQTSTLDELVASFAACVTAHGFQRAACMRIATPGQPVQPRILFAWGVTELSERYVAERLYRIDPTIQGVFGAVAPFTWAEVEAAGTNRDAAAFYDTLRATGLRNALVIPLHGPQGEVLAVILASEVETEFPEDLRRRMHVAATLFVTRGLTLMERSAELPALGLTRREIQCVYWIAQGKSDWEIARILDISEETVGWHVQNAKAKLGVARRAQLPGAAWRRGLLLDESPD